jgi:multimeric flavodoxin WrbA
MKVLALNSSPRSGGESYTVMMLNPLVEGMREAGADVEVVNLREKKLKIALAVSLAGQRRQAIAFIKTI